MGKLALNDIIVWGNGLVKAVSLEEHLSVYPRIIIDSPLIEVFKHDKQDISEFEEKYSCLKDIDGCYFVDYINYGEMPDAEIILSEGYEIAKEKMKSITESKILQKYNWHIQYLSKAKDIFNKIYGEFNLIRWNEEDENDERQRY